jgi:hypothetical protein
MPRDYRLMTVAQLAGLLEVSISELRKVLRAAPVGVSFIVHRTRVVDYREFLVWLRGLPCQRRAII